MNIYFNLGLFFALLATAWYLVTLGAVIFELTAAYIKDRPAVKSPYLRFMIKAKASLYSDTMRRYRVHGFEEVDALTGEHLAGTAALGLLYSTATLLLWPITLIVLTLKTLRKYNTDESFQLRVDVILKRKEKKEVHYDL